MRWTPLRGLLPALLVALALAPTAVAAPLHTMRSDGSTFVREDRFLPPAAHDPLRSAAARAPSRARSRQRFAVGAAVKKRTVRGELAQMLAAGAIDRATHDDRRAIYADALKLRRKLRGARRAALSLRRSFSASA